MVIDLVDIFQVEAKAMLEVLKLAWEWGFDKWKWKPAMLSYWKFCALVLLV
ncbi:hypothetical protein Godav_020624 [Gossypium davidsonii]|uniref:Uncharacterized protein n=1 Tax=Gossypium davidsonii TaxID=34287 RepID=A0A7J8R3V9_GOSDV|nr:hypothetical protein [Gossypium davidsonii]